jgi:hypothetical protein
MGELHSGPQWFRSHQSSLEASVGGDLGSFPHFIYSFNFVLSETRTYCSQGWPRTCNPPASPPECWNYKHVPLCSTPFSHFDRVMYRETFLYYKK